MIRGLLRQTLPRPLRDFFWYWRTKTLRQATRAGRRISRHSDGRVVSGTFAGMRYVTRSFGSSYPPKILGTYEKELTSIFETILTRGYATIIDIGAAEGYYAVGLAWRISSVHVVAFEGQPDAHEHLKSLARLNGVADRITLRGWCVRELLAESLQAPSPVLVICDCEGGERELLDPLAIDALRRADVLVEVHEFQSPGIARLIRERFSQSHDMTVIPVVKRTQNDWPAGAPQISIAEKIAAMQEYREPAQEWLFLTARHDS